MNLPRRLTLALYRAALQVMLERQPDFIVGQDSPQGAYLLRWYLTPWRHWQHRLGLRARAHPTRWNRGTARLARLLPNLYVHQFLRDDDDRALHDHPSWACSLILARGYIEHTIAAGGIHYRNICTPGHLRFLPTRHTHRIELHRDDHGDPIPCVTLFLFGPAVREWGFHCPHRGWVHYRDFTATDKPGEVGQGCDA